MPNRILDRALPVALLCLAAAAARASSPPPAGVVVESVTAGRAAAAAGLRAGDVLTGWIAAPSSSGDARGGTLATPFEVDRIEVEEAPLGGLRLRFDRGGAAGEAAVPLGRWGLTVRPMIPAGLLERYEQGRQALDSDDEARARQGAAAWASLARDLEAAGDEEAALWLAYRAAEIELDRGREDRAEAAYEDAARRSRSRESWASLMICAGHAAAANRPGHLARAASRFHECLDLAERITPGGLASAHMLTVLGVLARTAAELPQAEAYHRRALAINERRAPGSRQTSHSLNNLGAVAVDLGHLSEAEEYFRRSLELRRRIDPRGMDVSHSFNNLGALAWKRGDYAAAEDFLRQALALEERREPRSVGVAAMFANLGAVMMENGDAARARTHFARALAIEEEVVPGSKEVAGSLVNLGSASAALGERKAARRYFSRALDITQRVAPFGFEAAESEHELGRLAAREGARAEAERRLRRALSIREALAPESTLVAESGYELAQVYRSQGRASAALALLVRALDALDAQARRLGGADDSRGRFLARHGRIYRETLRLLLASGRREEAFHVLERSRARGLLALLAERPALDGELPPDLARERREVNAAYDRTLAALAGLTATGDEARRRALLDELGARRGRQRDIQSRLRAAAPRLAALEDPRPLDLAQARQTLDPGTLLLSYAVGPDSTTLFAVGPGEKDFAVFELPVREDALRAQVAELRRQIERAHLAPSRRKLGLLARSMGTLLLRPAAPEIARARRLVVIPDGPLHLVPFAALADPGSPRQAWLVEGRPISVAASATVLAELRKTPSGAPGAPMVVAFGDPVYPPAAAGSTAAPLAVWRALEARGLRLAPLPASRTEVESLVRLYGDRARSFLGAEATEEAAKASTGGAAIVHFACHGWLDDASPMDSALALSIPDAPSEDRGNGLLQAWEVFEQVRLKADLVTLSACQTGAGRELGGEGMLGLTRAFQFAGARAVLASLWSVSDAATARLIEAFYRRLNEGLSKGEALRLAQLDLIRQGGPRERGSGQADLDVSHPFFWAAFQLFGDGS